MISWQVHRLVKHKLSGHRGICFPEAFAIVTLQRQWLPEAVWVRGWQGHRNGMKELFLCVCKRERVWDRGQDNAVRGIRPPLWWKQHLADQIKVKLRWSVAAWGLRKAGIVMANANTQREGVLACPQKEIRTEETQGHTEHREEARVSLHALCSVIRQLFHLWNLLYLYNAL